MRIALLDPDADRAERYRSALAAAGYRCHLFWRVKSFLTSTLRDTFDLAIVAGPAKDAIVRHTLLAIQEREAAPPVLILLADAIENDIIDMLNAGADACLSIPPGEQRLLAHTRALLRRARMTRPPTQASVRFDHYAFDPVRCVAEVHGRTIDLTPKELALALLLFRNVGRDLSRQYLIDGVWARESGPCSRSLDTHISRIRHKLALNAEQGFQLSAIYSHGYRLDRILPDAEIATLAQEQAIMY